MQTISEKDFSLPIGPGITCEYSMYSTNVEKYVVPWNNSLDANNVELMTIRWWERCKGVRKWFLWAGVIIYMRSKAYNSTVILKYVCKSWVCFSLLKFGLYLCFICPFIFSFPILPRSLTKYEARLKKLNTLPAQQLAIFCKSYFFLKRNVG